MWQNPFRDIDAWKVTRPAIDHEVIDEAVDQAGLCRDDPAVYQAFANYAFDEAECCVSQQQVADDLGRSRESVNRAVRRLIAAGWLRIKAKCWSPGARWCHNVYELLAPFVVGAQTVRRIVRRAHQRVKRIRARFGGQDHTKGTYGRSGCRCGWCKPEPGPVGGPPPPLTSRVDHLTRLLGADYLSELRHPDPAELEQANRLAAADRKVGR